MPIYYIDVFGWNLSEERIDLIFGSVYPNEQYFEKTFQTGFISSEAFPFMEARGLIQDNNRVPILYYMNRHRSNKRILIDTLLGMRTMSNNWRFNKAFFRKKWKGEARLEDCWWLDQA